MHPKKLIKKRRFFKLFILVLLRISEAEPGKKASKYAQIDDSTVSRQHDNSSGQAGENTSNTNNKSEKGGNLWGKFFDKKSKKDNTPLIAPNDTTVDPSILTAAQINLPDQSVVICLFVIIN